MSPLALRRSPEEEESPHLPDPTPVETADDDEVLEIEVIEPPAEEAGAPATAEEASDAEPAAGEDDADPPLPPIRDDLCPCCGTELPEVNPGEIRKRGYLLCDGCGAVRSMPHEGGAGAAPEGHSRLASLLPSRTVAIAVVLLGALSSGAAVFLQAPAEPELPPPPRRQFTAAAAAPAAAPQAVEAPAPRLEPLRPPEPVRKATVEAPPPEPARPAPPREPKLIDPGIYRADPAPAPVIRVAAAAPPTAARPAAATAPVVRSAARRVEPAARTAESPWSRLRTGMGPTDVARLVGKPRWTERSVAFEFWMYEVKSSLANGVIVFEDGVVYSWRLPSSLLAAR